MIPPPARERITTLKRVEKEHTKNGQYIQAGQARASIRVVRYLWGE
jgi:hypothetical protein